MKTLIVRICLWLLARCGYETSFILPVSVQPYADELADLVTNESGMVHGSTDILGDSWLKFRRVATMLKKAHPELPKSDIFKAVIMVHEASTRNVQN